MKKFIEQIQTINRYYQKLILLSEEKEELLNADKIEEADRINKREMMILFDFEKEMENLQSDTLRLCEFYQVENQRMRSLFPFMSDEEKEEVMTCQRNAVILDHKMYMNEQIARSKMAFPEILRQINIQNAKESGHNSGTMYDRKY